jgi:hypothetical protein
MAAKYFDPYKKRVFDYRPPPGSDPYEFARSAPGRPINLSFELGHEVHRTIRKGDPDYILTRYALAGIGPDNLVDHLNAESVTFAGLIFQSLRDGRVELIDRACVFLNIMGLSPADKGKPVWAGPSPVGPFSMAQVDGGHKIGRVKFIERGSARACVEIIVNEK